MQRETWKTSSRLQHLMQCENYQLVCDKHTHLEHSLTNVGDFRSGTVIPSTSLSWNWPGLRLPVAKVQPCVVKRQNQG